MTGEEPNLSGKTGACSGQLDFQVEEKDLDGAAQSAYALRAAGRHIVDSNQCSVLRTEHRVNGTRIQNRHSTCGSFTIEERYLSGGLETAHIGHSPIT